MTSMRKPLHIKLYKDFISCFFTILNTFFMKYIRQMAYLADKRLQ